MHSKPVRYLVLIDAAGASIARLFDDQLHQLNEIDGGSEEVAVMTRGLAPEHSADGADWARALRGHSAAERAAARVYTLDV
jgi:hypothetical protein